ncbi:MAG TPA: hypothetical protein VFV34_03170 [Blastocatellia bacterium]|nr:hypothetical protein [Blastocatellia bacterium]
MQQAITATSATSPEIIQAATRWIAGSQVTETLEANGGVCDSEGTAISLTFQIESTIRHLRANGVLVHSRADVNDYLLRFPDILAALPIVCDLCLTEGDPWEEVVLDIYRDREFLDEYVTLCLRRTKYGSRTIDDIDAIRARFETLLYGKTGWLLVTTDFRPPAGINE